MRTIPTSILLIGLANACSAQQTAVAQNDAQGPHTAIAQATAPAKKAASKKPARATKAAPAADDQAAPAAKPAAPPSKLPPNSTIYVDAGYADWGLSGNQTKFRQYATPPTGWFLRDLRYSPLLKSPAETAFFDFKGIGQDDFRAATRLGWDYGATQASGFLSRSRFFDPSAGPINLSNWTADGFNARRSLSRDFALTFQYRRDSQQLYFPVPYPALNQNTDYWDAVAGGKLGHGYLRANFSNFHYADQTGTLLNFDVQTTGLRYLYDITPAVGIEAAVSHANIRQSDLPQSRLDTYSIGGDFALSPTADLALLLQRRQFTLPTVQNAYVRNQNVGTVNLSERWRSWRAQVGLRLQNDDRVNGDQTYVDVPKWSTVEGRLAGKLNRNVKVSLRGYTQTLSDPPASVTADPRSLYFNARSYWQARLEGGLPSVNGYLAYTYLTERNSARSTDITTNQYTVGGTWEISPALNLFAEFHHENWTGRTDSTVYPALNNFLPDSSTGVVEMNWNLGRRAYVSVSYTGFATFNDNPLLLQDGNTRGSFVTINSRYRFPAGYELGLIVAPWTYHDTVASALNYNASVLMVTGSVRF